MFDGARWTAGHTWHKRGGGLRNAFRYSMDCCLIEPEAPAPRAALFALNGRNLASVSDRDHGGPRGAGAGAAWVRRVFAEEGLAPLADCRLWLLTQPRLLGHLFNPVSLWLAIDAEDRLRAVVAEVNNTFGQRHSYLLRHPDLRPIAPEDALEAAKIFHVSPFQEIKGRYRFQFDLSPERIAYRIVLKNEDAGLAAGFDGRLRRLTSGAILYSLARRPFGSLRVLTLIYWQALRLYWKGAFYRDCPEPLEKEVSS